MTSSLRVKAEGVPAPKLVVATNCNAGIKEVLWFGDAPERWALWGWRSPDNAELEGKLPRLAISWRKENCFNPCERLVDDSRCEFKPGCRKRWCGEGSEELQAPNRLGHAASAASR